LTGTAVNVTGVPEQVVPTGFDVIVIDTGTGELFAITINARKATVTPHSLYP
jgi:hypothetical protein